MRKIKKIPILFPPGSMMDITNEPIQTDPMGSYTGLVKDVNEVPVQDADDL